MTDATQERALIVGAGQAGASLAQKLRTEGYDGAVTLIGDEPVPPYERPPLSKGYLMGEQAQPRCAHVRKICWKSPGN